MKIVHTAHSLASAIVSASYNYNDNRRLSLKMAAVDLLNTARATERLHRQACKGHKVKEFRKALKRLGKLVRETRKFIHGVTQDLRKLRATETRTVIAFPRRGHRFNPR